MGRSKEVTWGEFVRRAAKKGIQLDPNNPNLNVHQAQALHDVGGVLGRDEHVNHSVGGLAGTGITYSARTTGGRNWLARRGAEDRARRTQRRKGR